MVWLGVGLGLLDLVLFLAYIIGMVFAVRKFSPLIKGFFKPPSVPDP